MVQSGGGGCWSFGTSCSLVWVSILDCPRRRPYQGLSGEVEQWPRGEPGVSRCWSHDEGIWRGTTTSSDLPRANVRRMKAPEGIGSQAVDATSVVARRGTR